jgi:hypothetical protein
MLMQRNERERVTNSPIEIMQLPTGKKVLAKALPMAAAAVWCDGAAAVDKLVTAAAAKPNKRELMRDAMAAMLEHLLAYDPEWPADLIREHATINQISDAFYAVWKDNDPFAIGERNKMAAIQEQLAFAEKVGTLAPMLARASQMQSGEQSAG